MTWVTIPYLIGLQLVSGWVTASSSWLWLKLWTQSWCESFVALTSNSFSTVLMVTTINPLNQSHQATGLRGMGVTFGSIYIESGTPTLLAFRIFNSNWFHGKCFDTGESGSAQSSIPQQHSQKEMRMERNDRMTSSHILSMCYNLLQKRQRWKNLSDILFNLVKALDACTPFQVIYSSPFDNVHVLTYVVTCHASMGVL